ncbi:MAG TPA: outer membrane beta-barrel protein [Acidobacteriaceae bacterium]|jgi:opacity protein-like surface antigen|nr:outer membrane beta-barrel protein [Acidobacteriaceae bacterium]
MKKSLFLFLLLIPIMAIPAFAQESRQDISVSGTAIIPPYASGNTVQLHATAGYAGALVSYRYLLTPHGGLELNYQYNQNVQHFCCVFGSYHIHDRFQEFSGAYVYSFNFKNWNPFIEGGAAGFMFSPIDDSKTDTFGISRNTNVGAIYGAGIAYEISPSFDIRAEFRGLLMKTPTFNYPGNDFRTNVYYNIYDPVIGIAYHF